MIDNPTISGNGHVRPVPEDYEILKRWHNVIRHANSIIVRGNLQLVTMTVLVDADGKPILWGDIDQSALFPRNRSIVVVGE